MNMTITIDTTFSNIITNHFYNIANSNHYHQQRCLRCHGVLNAFIGAHRMWHSNAHLAIAPPRAARTTSAVHQQLSMATPMARVNLWLPTRKLRRKPLMRQLNERFIRFSHTIYRQFEENAWWEVDLGSPSVIDCIRIWNRTDTPLGLYVSLSLIALLV
jgi:hypothetical protein